MTEPRRSHRLTVTSHVGRDLLASAAAFKTEEAVVWEYVVNSLQYVDRGSTPTVEVKIDLRGRRITIADNGRGMSAVDLQHFFTMHGENRDRRVGRTGRGKFGTGKSAAFGIASTLVVDTVRGGVRNVARLTRAAIDGSDGTAVPVEWQAREERTEEANGTRVVIEDIHLRRLEAPKVIEYVERHLAAFRSVSPRVAINNHVCEYRDPQYEASFTFEPAAEQREVLGDVRLTVRVARAPLPEIDQGVAITSGTGNLVAVERAGVERKDYGAFLFGEVDVPRLESADSPLQPFDPSRNLQLNPRHPVAAVLIGFIGSRLEEVRERLVAEGRQARQSEMARRLVTECEKIAEILNSDFKEQDRRLADIRAVASRGSISSANSSRGGEIGTDENVWVEGVEEEGVVEATGKNGKGSGGHARPAPELPRPARREIEGRDSVDPAGGVGRRSGLRQRGFQVDYRHMGDEEDRSKYDRHAMTILINLDHPVVAAALTLGGVEDPAFRRLSYEIAFSEYAVALANEVAQIDPDIPADDLLYDVRSTLNRVARAAVTLYRS